MREVNKKLVIALLIVSVSLNLLGCSKGKEINHGSLENPTPMIELQITNTTIPESIAADASPMVLQSTIEPTEVAIPTEVSEPTATSTPTPEPTVTLTPTQSQTFINTPSPSPIPTNTPVPTSTPTPEPTNTPTPEPTATCTPKPTKKPEPTNTPTPKPTSTPTPSPSPTSTPTPKPTSTPIPTLEPKNTTNEEKLENAKYKLQRLAKFYETLVWGVEDEGWSAFVHSDFESKDHKKLKYSFSATKFQYDIKDKNGNIPSNVNETKAIEAICCYNYVNNDSEFIYFQDYIKNEDFKEVSKKIFGDITDNNYKPNYILMYRAISSLQFLYIHQYLITFKDIKMTDKYVISGIQSYYTIPIYINDEKTGLTMIFDNQDNLLTIRISGDETDQYYLQTYDIKISTSTEIKFN